ncbi:MAG: nucleotidyltransferase family protein [Oligoflexia bacterium]|nr:nucleotidyltransferase family protein [Oligoflexia bacterium]
MQAVILAGGFGTRISTVVKDVPKPMAPIAGKPFLHYIVEKLIRSSIHEVLMLTHHKAEIIKQYFLDGKNFNHHLHVHYSQEPKPLGTAGAIFYAWEQLHDRFLLLNGDTFFDICFQQFYDFFVKEDLQVVMALKKISGPADRFGTIITDEFYRVLAIQEKTQISHPTLSSCLINSGIYCFKKEALFSYYLSWKQSPPSPCSLEKDIFPLLIESEKLYAFKHDGLFIDIGIPDDYAIAQEILGNKRIHL